MEINSLLLTNLSMGRFLQKRKSRKGILIFHGSVTSYISFHPDHFEISEKNETEVKSLIRAKQRPLILLATPYINSYVHETILLSTKELGLADSQTLPFSRSPKNNRTITSIELNDKKALTVHSHLTDLGVIQLDLLKKIKSSITWKPAVLYFMQSFLLVSKQTAQLEGIFRLFLSDEMMEVQWHQDYPKLQHTFFLHQNLPMEKNIEHIGQIYDDKKNSTIIESFQFTNQHIHKNTLPYKILANLQHLKSRKLKSKTQNQLKRRKSLKIIKTIHRNHVLGFLLLLTLIWTGWTTNRVNQAVEKKRTLQASVDKLKIQSKKLNKIAKQELEFHKLYALRQTTRQLQLAPHLILIELDKILPDSLWLQQITISHGNIIFEILDNEETELTKLIEEFNSKIGKTNLEKSEIIQIKHVDLKKYYISTSHINPKIIYEKLDQP